MIYVIKRFHNGTWNKLAREFTDSAEARLYVRDQILCDKSTNVYNVLTYDIYNQKEGSAKDTLLFSSRLSMDKCDWCDAQACDKGTGILCLECWESIENMLDSPSLKHYVKTPYMHPECSYCIKKAVANGVCADHAYTSRTVVHYCREAKCMEKVEGGEKFCAEHTEKPVKSIDWSFMSRVLS